MIDTVMEKKKKKGEVIFCEHEPGDTLFLLKKGEVRLVKLIIEKEKTLAILKEGDIFGEMAIIKKLPRTATAIVEKDVELVELNHNDFFKLVQKSPSLGFRLLKLLIFRLKDQRRKIHIITMDTPEKKILDVLLMFKENGKGHNISHCSIEIEISTNDLASWAGLPLDECSKTLQHLERTKKIAIKEENTIIIQNVEAIKTYLHHSQ